MAKDRFVRHANLISALTILSRFAGLVRDKACTYFCGLDWQWSAFWMGFQFPNLFRRIFGEGALTAVFVPAYTEMLHKQGRAAASRLASATATLLILMLTAITLVGEAIVIPLARSPDVLDQNRLACVMIALMLPYCVMVCLVALLGAIATVHERFTAQSLAPIVLSLSMAGAAALSVLFMTTELPLERRIYWVAISVLAAGVMQVAIMLPGLMASGVRLRPVLGFGQSGIGNVLKPLLPIILGYSAVQINTFMDTQIAWWLSPDGHNGSTVFMLFGREIHVAMLEGAVAKLSVAQRVYLLPVGIFGVATAMAVFPAMARAATVGDTGELKRLLVAGLRKTLFLSIPSSVGMILVARPLITLIYLGGSAKEEDVDRAYWASIFFCLGIWAFEAQMVILRVFFVLKDTKTPTWVALGMIGLNFTLNLVLVWPLREGGIALATTISAVVQGGILLVILRRRLGPLGLTALGSNVGKSLGATVLMLGAGLLLLLIPMPWEKGGQAMTTGAKWLTSGVKLPLLVAVCGGIYVGLAWLMKMEEVGDLPLVGRYLKRHQSRIQTQ